jgi:FAD/FMN-containing dehydrogenase
MIELDKLAAIVGNGNASREPAELDACTGDTGVRPDCLVRPACAADIEKIVALARETGTPLVPVSSGPPHLKGAAAPSLEGAVALDLSGMKRIISLDRPNRVAMFEPGVTFDELIEAAAREGLRLNMPLLPRRTKSVVGSLLDREPVIMPKYHWDIADPLTCVEVVFGTGDIFRTGSAAGPGTVSEQWAAGSLQKEAAGPSAASWYRVIQGAQGTMGVVTWASARCEILPGCEEAYLAGSAELDKILEMLHWLVRLRLVNECLVLNSADLANIMAPDNGDYEKIIKSLPPWALFFNIAGYDYLPEERVSGQVKDMMALARRVGLEPQKEIGGVAAAGLLEKTRHACTEPYWKLRRRGASRDVFCLALYDKLPELAGMMHDMAAAAGYPSGEMGVYLQPVVQGVNCHVEFNLFHDPENGAEAKMVGKLAADATAGLMERGAFFSRPYGESAGMIMNRDAATAAALKKVKAIVDPDNIMNPGKLCF